MIYFIEMLAYIPLVEYNKKETGRYMAIVLLLRHLKCRRVRENAKAWNFRTIELS